MLLKREAIGSVVVFVAEHQDIYNADTVVHEPMGDPSDPTFLEGLLQIGCTSVWRQLHSE